MVNNKIKACVVFLGMLYVLYGGKLVNVWRSGSGGSGVWRSSGLLGETRAEYSYLPGTRDGGGFSGQQQMGAFTRN